MDGAPWPKAKGINSGGRSPLLALDNEQLAAIMMAARGLLPEKRSVFLERIAARLQLRGPDFTDADLERAMRLALQGLIHSAA